MSAKTKTNQPARRAPVTPPREPTHDEIALNAMAIWVEEGRPEGRNLEHWLLAEARLRQALQAETATGRPARRTTRHGARQRQPEGLML